MNLQELEKKVKDLKEMANSEPFGSDKRNRINDILREYQKDLDQVRVFVKLTPSQLNDLIMPIAIKRYTLDQAYTKWVETENEDTEGTNFIAFLNVWHKLDDDKDFDTSDGWREEFENGYGEDLEYYYENAIESFMESGDYDEYDWEDFPKYKDFK